MVCCKYRYILLLYYSNNTMSDDLDWEVRHPSTPFYVHLAGNSIAYSSWVNGWYLVAPLYASF